MGRKAAMINFGLNRKLCVMLLILIINITTNLGSDQDYLNPHHCMSTGNYTTNTTYSNNLDAALSSLSTNMPDTGFRNASVGEGQDRVNAVALCRGDVLLNECRACVENAVAELVNLCPNRKQAIRWYELCMLHYSNLPMRGIQTNGAGELRNTDDVPNPAQFRRDRAALLDALRPRAASGSSLLKAGAGSRKTSDSDTLYGMVQCVPTLSPEECDICLAQASQGLPRAAQGARALRPSCNLRYELYLFYNERRVQELNVLVVPNITDSLPGKSSDNRGRVAVIIVVSTAVFVVVLVASAAVFLRRMRKKSADEILELQQYSSANKDISSNLIS